MGGLLWLKRFTAAVCFALSLVPLVAANAAPLSLSSGDASQGDRTVSWSPLDGSPKGVQVLVSNFVFVDGSSGWAAGIAYVIDGRSTEGGGIYYAYAVDLEGGQGSFPTVALEPAPALVAIGSEPLLGVNERVCTGGWATGIVAPVVLGYLASGQRSRGGQPSPTPDIHTPEPSALLLVSVGLLGFWRFRRRRK